MPTFSLFALIAVVAATTVGMAGCALSGGKSDGVALPTPRMDGLVTPEGNRGPIGSAMTFAGYFPPGPDYSYRLAFNGTFTNSKGEVKQVSTESGAVRPTSDGSSVDWGGLGPHCNPLSDNCFDIGDGEGQGFNGTVKTILEHLPTGNTAESAPMNFHYGVTPSVFVSRFAPSMFDCGKPVSRVIHSLPMAVCVHAEGFAIAQIEQTLEFPQLSERFGDQFKKRVLARTLKTPSGDVCFVDESFHQMPPTPPQSPLYGAVLTTKVTDPNGKAYANTLVTTVIEPIQIVVTGNSYIAERLPPQPATVDEAGNPVATCRVAGDYGELITKSVNRSVTMQRALTTSWSEGWSQGLTSTHVGTQTVGFSVTGSNSASLSFTGQRSGTGTDSFSFSTGNVFSSSNSFSSGLSTSTSDSTSTTASTSFASSTSGAVGSAYPDPRQPDIIQVQYKVTGANAHTYANVNTANLGVEVPVLKTGGSQADSSGGSTTDTEEAYSQLTRNPLMINEAGSNSTSYGDATAVNNATAASGTSSLAFSSGSGFAGSNNTTNSNSNSTSDSTSTTFSTSNSTSTTVSTSVSTSDSTAVSTSQTLNWGNTNSITLSASSAVTDSSTKFCIPNRYCAWLQQINRRRYPAAVLLYNACGVPKQVGSIFYDDWEIAVELTNNMSLDACMQPNKLKPAACLEPPCAQ